MNALLERCRRALPILPFNNSAVSLLHADHKVVSGHDAFEALVSGHAGNSRHAQIDLNLRRRGDEHHLAHVATPESPRTGELPSVSHMEAKLKTLNSLSALHRPFRRAA